MSFIEWKSDLSVKVVEIDRQHQHLVGMINDLHTAMIQHQSKDVLRKIVDGLVVYAGTHFQTEEKYFARFAYPDASNHMKEHADFTKKAAEFKVDFDAGTLGLSVEILQFLSNWLHNHIESTDKKYSAYFNAKGLR